MLGLTLSRRELLGDFAGQFNINSGVCFAGPPDGSQYAGLGEREFLAFTELDNASRDENDTQYNSGAHWLWGIVGENDTINGTVLTHRLDAASSEVELHFYRGSSLRARIDISIQGAGTLRTNAAIRTLVRKTGTSGTSTFQFDALQTTPQTEAYTLSSGSAVSSQVFDFDQHCGSLGYLSVGLQNRAVGDAYPVNAALGGLFLLFPPDGVTLADLGMDTPEATKRMLVDPHAEVARILAAYPGCRIDAYDYCDLNGNRKLLTKRTPVLTTDKLVGKHGTGGELAFVQSKSAPTANTCMDAPFAVASRFSRMRNSVFSPVHTEKVPGRNVLVSVGIFADNLPDGHPYLERRRLDGVPFAPGIPVVKAHYNRTQARPYYGRAAGAGAGLYENHYSSRVVYDPGPNPVAQPELERLVVAENAHHSIGNDGGDVIEVSGSVGVIEDGAIPATTPMPDNGSTGTDATTSYLGMIAIGGNVLVIARANSNSVSFARVTRVDSAGAVTAIDLTADPSDGVSGILQFDVAALPDGMALISWRRRLPPARLGDIGCQFMLLNPADLSEAFGPRDGTDLSGQIGSISAVEPSLLLIPQDGPNEARAQIDALPGTPLDLDALPDDRRVVLNGIITHTVGGNTYVGIHVVGRDNPGDPAADRTSRRLSLSQIVVFLYNSSTKTLGYIRTNDLWADELDLAGRANPVKRADDVLAGVARDFHGRVALTDSGPVYAYGIYGAETDFTDGDYSGHDSADGGERFDVATVTNWWTDSPQYRVVGKVADVADYGAAALMVYPVKNAPELVDVGLVSVGDVGAAVPSQNSSIPRIAEFDMPAVLEAPTTAEIVQAINDDVTQTEARANAQVAAVQSTLAADGIANAGERLIGTGLELLVDPVQDGADANVYFRLYKDGAPLSVTDSDAEVRIGHYVNGVPQYVALPNQDLDDWTEGAFVFAATSLEAHPVRWFAINGLIDGVEDTTVTSRDIRIATIQDWDQPTPGGSKHGTKIDAAGTGGGGSVANDTYNPEGVGRGRTITLDVYEGGVATTRQPLVIAPGDTGMYAVRFNELLANGQYLVGHAKDPVSVPVSGSTTAWSVSKRGTHDADAKFSFPATTAVDDVQDLTLEVNLPPADGGKLTAKIRVQCQDR